MPIVKADRDVCMGSGMCVRTAPGVFDQDPVDGLVVVLAADVAEGAMSRVVQAIDQCPVAALSLVADAPDPNDQEGAVR
jgi:ferredoxin